MRMLSIEQLEEVVSVYRESGFNRAETARRLASFNTSGPK